MSSFVISNVTRQESFVKPYGIKKTSRRRLRGGESSDDALGSIRLIRVENKKT
tara:strand:+ start:94 stop:252 length:159 start_codon:yes stop_codon:yes gene_type:complete